VQRHDARPSDAPAVVKRLFPEYEEEYARRGWKMFPHIERVYVNERARNVLGWLPKYDFGYLLGRLKANEDWRSPLTHTIGAKGYHSNKFAEGPYPVD